MNRTILHCDLNGFYASVECVFNPKLLNVPMAVAGNPENRHGIILAKNELAKKYNIQTAETIWQAKNKCPDLILVPPRHEEYERYSKLVNDIYSEFTDLVEPFGIDESWLDVTSVKNLFGTGKEIADTIRKTIKQRLGLTVSVGVSFNKVFAKLGSDYKKPDATTEISLQNYKDIVWKLPVGDLLYVGKVTKETLNKLYIKTIGDLANSEKTLIIRKLGKMGELIHDYANGIDNSLVSSIQSQHDIKSIGNGTTFKRDLIGFSEINASVLALSDEVASRMRRNGVQCSVVSVTIKDSFLKSISKQKTLFSPTHLTKEISAISMDLIRSCWNNNAPVRSITITGSHLIPDEDVTQQLSFFTSPNSIDKINQEKLETAMYKIRNKYGKNSISLAGSIKSDLTHDD